MGLQLLQQIEQTQNMCLKYVLSGWILKYRKLYVGFFCLSKILNGEGRDLTSTEATLICAVRGKADVLPSVHPRLGPVLVARELFHDWCT